MMRRLSAVLVLTALVALPGLAWASNHDQTQFFLPGATGGTTGVRVHRSTVRTHQNLTIARGNIWAVGGYKTALHYTHRATASLTNQAMGLAESAVSQQRLGYEGSVLGISLAASQALTAGQATAEATIRKGGTVGGTGLTAVIGVGGAAGHPQFAHRTQARGLDVFGASDEVGCRLTTTAAISPVATHLLCTVSVEF